MGEEEEEDIYEEFGIKQGKWKEKVDREFTRNIAAVKVFGSLVTAAQTAFKLWYEVFSPRNALL